MNIFGEVNRIKLEKRLKAIETAEQRSTELHKIPEIVSIDNMLSAVPSSLFVKNALSEENYNNTVNKLKKETEKLRKLREEVLIKNGYPADYDEPKFECRKCRDTGYVKLEKCDCMDKLYAKIAYEQSGIGNALKESTFENFNLNLYTGEIEDNKSPRDVMQEVFKKAKGYAEAFSPGEGNLLLMGGTGLGKTHLAAAIADVVLKKGYTVVYEISPNIINQFREEHFAGTENNTNKYYTCDLLIIDDLGVEPKTEYNVSVLTELINSRIINKKNMIISTNYNPAELNKYYSARVMSRLLGEFSPLVFKGKDIRFIKKTL
ncbi:ATP-binding protein [Eubacteriales bacterium OttesenSCG-928-G02]|nr:ATP-binding protein [Eubacteriales bacterium OttesenSCG-928-G02]